MKEVSASSAGSEAPGSPFRRPWCHPPSLGCSLRLHCAPLSYAALPWAARGSSCHCSLSDRPGHHHFKVRDLGQERPDGKDHTTNITMAGQAGKICKLCCYAEGMCQTGSRKSHECSDPQCRLHGVVGRASGAASIQTRQVNTRTGGDAAKATSTTRPCPEKVMFRTRRGLHLQFDPEPNLDQWTNTDTEVQYDPLTGRH